MLGSRGGALIGVLRQRSLAVDDMSLMEVRFSSGSKDVSVWVVSVTSVAEWLGYLVTAVATE
jgi:hypothetical protein